MPQRLKLTTSKTDENEFSSLSEMLKSLNKEFDEAHNTKLKHLKIVEGVPQAECPNCKALSLLTVTKCPNCGMQFEEETK